MFDMQFEERCQMKNPWKRLSKINPQPEDGTRRINNEVFNALIKAKLPTSEMSVVLTVISKTWGFGKDSDAISTSQFAEVTGLTPRAIKKARQSLKCKRIVYFSASERVYRGSPLNEYFFNKHYDTWKTRDTKKGEQTFTGEQKGKKRVNERTPTKETITKEKEKIYKKESLGMYEVAVKIPESYSIQKEHLEYALSKGLSNSQAKDQFEAFKLHFQKTGKKYQSWYATYQTWVRNAIKRGYIKIIQLPKPQSQEDIEKELAEKLA